MKKILVINTAPFQFNGITSVIMNYYNAMDKENLHFDFIVNRVIDDKLAEKLKSEGCGIYILDRNKNVPKYMFNLFRIMKKNKYDFVHAHGNSATLLFESLPAKMAGVKKVAVHSHNTTCKSLKLHNFLWPLFSKTFNISFACGEEAGKWLFRNKPFEVLKNGIDVEKYRYNSSVREQLRKELDIGSDFVIGHVGVFNEQKNHAFMLDFYSELLKENSDLKLMLVGDGRLRNQIEEKIKNLGIEDKVILLGRKANVFDYLNVFDVFILPSKYEGFPVSLVEAQASGLICYVTDNIDQSVDLSKSIEYCKGNDLQDWKLKLKDYIESEKLNRVNKSSQNIAAISNSGFDINKSAKHLEEIYTK